jgi:MFS family permease
MIAVALPELRDEFNISHAAIGWLVSAYLIAMAVAQPAGGRLSDQLGRKRVYRIGLVGFLACSLAATFSPTFEVLVIFRTGQAIAGAVLIPNGMAMLRESVPTGALGRINGLNGALIGTSAAIGPLLGAGLLALGSWRLLFLMNVPVVAAALLLSIWLPYEDAPSRGRLNLDLRGLALFAAVLVIATFLLGSLRSERELAVLTVAVAMLILFGAGFIWSQVVAHLPLVQWQLFRTRAFVGASGSVMLSNLVMYTTLLTIPFFVREVQGGDAARSGLLLGAMSVLMAVVSPISGRMSDSMGRRWPALVGSIIALAASLVLFFGLDEDVSFVYMALGLALLGVGTGSVFGSATTAAIESAPKALAGSAAGTNSMMRYVGSIVGAGILAGVLSTDAVAPGIDTFRVIMGLVAVFAALSILSASQIHLFPKQDL